MSVFILLHKINKLCAVFFEPGRSNQKLRIVLFDYLFFTLYNNNNNNAFKGHAARGDGAKNRPRQCSVS